MTTCVSCGSDVTGKKFCHECGTPTAGVSAANKPATCPRCSGEVKVGAAFCMHCGSALHAAPVVAQSATRPCPACHLDVPMGTAFCVHCGQSMSASVASPIAAAPAFCTNCGKQNVSGVAFCGGCGNPLTAPQATPYGTSYGQAGPQQQPYGQPQYPPQQSQYNQGGYPQQYQQQPMTLRCPVCMAMSPMGTPNCPSCRTSLLGVVPTPINMPVQGQQGMLGGMGNLLQGGNGQMAMGALGGAAAVIGGQMLLHGVENSIENRIEGDMGYGGGYEHQRHHHREEGLFGGLGDIANDVGLF